MMQVVEFVLADGRFAIAVDDVREILDYQTGAHVPDSPDFVLGIAEIRGDIVTIVDMRRRLNLGAAAPTAATRIIVVEPIKGGRDRALGLVVDCVCGVGTCKVEDIGDLPRLARGCRAAHVAGVMRGADGLVMLIDAQGLAAAELPTLGHAA